MEDLETGDPLLPPNFVTIHHLREQWLQRRQPQQKQKQLEARGRPPTGKPPQRRRTPPLPPPAQKDQRKQPERELPRRETDVERERGKASPWNESDSRPSPGNRCWGRRNASVEEGSSGRQAIDSNGPKPSEKSSRGEYAGLGADKKAGPALVKDQRKQPEQEIRRGKTNTERQRVRASPGSESDPRPSPPNGWAVRGRTSVKEGSDGRQAMDSNGPNPLEKSSGGEYGGFGADEKAESALVIAVSVVAESAKAVKKTEEGEMRKRRKNKSNNRWKDIVAAKEKGAKLEEGEVNEPAEELKKEKFQRASSEGQNVMPESKEVRTEENPEESVVHAPAKEPKRAGSESENVMPESKEVRVEVENVAANASHARAKAEALNKQVWVVNSKVEMEGELRNLSLQHDSRRGGFQSRRHSRGDYRGHRVIEGKKQQMGVRKQSCDGVWVRKEISDGHAGESSS